jgi:hypothetical protein
MKKVLISMFLIAAVGVVFTGCIKNRPYVTTANPSMTANVGTFKFVASSVTPATIDTQVVDTSTTLVITGNSSDRIAPYDKIVISVANFKQKTGVFSIVQGQAGAVYYHGGVTGKATGGVVSITEVTTTTVTGYFSFNTDDGVAVTNGNYTVGQP